jgi:hypothetical protein
LLKVPVPAHETLPKVPVKVDETLLKPLVPTQAIFAHATLPLPFT